MAHPILYTTQTNSH